MTRLRKSALSLLWAFLLLGGLASTGAAQELQIYFIDVEGGQSTLIVTPSHQSLLVDAGFASDGRFESIHGDAHKARDASRIARVASAAGLKPSCRQLRHVRQYAAQRGGHQ
jgi:hypothetical protein